MVFTEKTFSQCLSSLNNINAILFFQTNFGLACEMADKIKKTFQQEEVVIIDFQDDEKGFIQKLQNELCDGFFSTKKLIKVYNFKPNGKSKIKDELKFLNDEKFNNKLILFFAPELDGKSAIKNVFEKGDFTASIACYDDDEKTASEYISQFCQEHQLKIAPQAQKSISEMLHGDRIMLKGELEKLFMLYGTSKPLTEQDVENAIENEQEFNPVDLFDAVLSGDVIKAIKIFDMIKQSEDNNIIVIVRAFIYNLENILKMRQDIENNLTNVEDATKFIFWKRKYAVQQILKKLSVKHLERYYQQLLDIEKEAKKYGNEIATRFFEKTFLLKG